MLLYVARGVRGFGDGFAIIVLPAYLSAVGFSAGQIGLIASASLLGTALFTLVVGFVAPRYDLRDLLLAGAVLMACTGVAFPNVDVFAVIAIVAFIGTINPSTGDLGVLVPLEHAMLAHDAADQERTRIFARYSLIGALSMALGSLAAAAPISWPRPASRRWLRSRSCSTPMPRLVSCAWRSTDICHTHTWMRQNPGRRSGRRGLVVYKLAALFSLDAFAGGFVVQSLLALWLFQRFDMSLSAASVFFFWTSTLSAFSYPVAAWLSKRIGLVNTMVFTHIPSSIFLILAAISPSLILTQVLLLLRAALSQMDVPTRTSS